MAFYPDTNSSAVTNLMPPDAMFPEWQGHLLVGSLKFRRLYLVEIGDDNQPVAERVILDGEIGRIRDVAVGPGGAFGGEVFLLSDEVQGGLWRLKAR
tara:strand:- start:228 stop:518 length:291 start_codon:yes stop_codon:yes gene_type:complete